MVLPGLFSTTTGWLQRSCNSFPIRRPDMSSGPPGGNGTTSRTGFDGKSWPCASAPAAKSKRATAKPRLMSHLLGGRLSGPARIVVKPAPCSRRLHDHDLCVASEDRVPAVGRHDDPRMVP